MLLTCSLGRRSAKLRAIAPQASPGGGAELRILIMHGGGCDMAIKLNVGTWHAGPYFEQAQISFFNLEFADTNAVDHQSCLLDTIIK